MSQILKNNIISLIYFFVIIIVCYFVKWIWDNILKKITFRSKLNSEIIKKTRNGVIFFVFFSGIRILWERISFLIKVKTPIKEKLFVYIPNIIYSFTVLSIAFIVSGVVEGFIGWYLEEVANKTKSKTDEEFMLFFKRILRIVIFFIAATIILSKFNQPIHSILGAAGIASLAIAFAAQDTLSNMISGFVIMIDKPFRIGDKIKLSSGEIGEVVEIGLRSTKILSSENNLIIVSNSEMAKSRIVNFSSPNEKIKIKLKISCSYVPYPEKIKSLLTEICNANLFFQSQPEVYIVEFDNLKLIFIFSLWIDYKDETKILDWIIPEIKRKFEDEKIEVFFIRKEM